MHKTRHKSSRLYRAACQDLRLSQSCKGAKQPHLATLECSDFATCSLRSPRSERWWRNRPDNAATDKRTNISGGRDALAPWCGAQVPNKIGLPVGVRGIPTTLDGARGKPGAFAVGGDQPAGSNPSNSPRLVNCSPQKLESYLFGILLPSDQLPKTQRSATEKPHRRVEEPGRMRRKLQGMFLAQRCDALRVRKNKTQARHLLNFSWPNDCSPGMRNRLPHQAE